MRERIDTCGPEAEDIWISTFHSMCVFYDVISIVLALIVTLQS